MDTEVTIPFVDGLVNTQEQLSLQSSAGGVVPETALRSNSNPVSDANPLPQKLLVPPLTYEGPGVLTVGVASGVLITPGTYARTMTIQTLPGSTNNVFLRNDGSPAAVNTGAMCKAAGGTFTWGTTGMPLPTGNITAITDAGAPQTVMITGG